MPFYVVAVCSLFLSLVGHAGAADGVVDVHSGEIVSIGHPTIPQVFGLSAYGGAGDFATDEGRGFLSHYQVDWVGLGEILGQVLPQGNKDSLDVHQLQSWFDSGNGTALFEKSLEYHVLKSGNIRAAGAQPFIYLKNPDGWCQPAAEAEHCLPKGGTPSGSTESGVEDFTWWKVLFEGFFNAVRQADPQINVVHIWNEPNAHFWHDIGDKEGKYYATFFKAIATGLKDKFSNLSIGGPVTWDPATGPTPTTQPASKQYSNWIQFAKPLIDSALPDKLLDSLDWHAYDINAPASELACNMHVVNLYSRSKFNFSLSNAITETNFRLPTLDSWYNRSEHFILRTLPLIANTLTLMQHPDKVKTRHIFDYKAQGKTGFFSFAGDSSSSTMKVTPEMEMYSLLGMFKGGERVLTSLHDAGPITSKLPISLVAALVRGNLSTAVGNFGDKQVSLAMNVSYFMSFREPSFNGWGAVLDTESLREFPPPPLPGQELLNVPAKSLVFITYPWLIEAVPPIRLLSVTEIPPYNADIIMLPLSHNQIDCQLKESGFSHCIHVSPIAVEFKVPKSLYQTTKNAALRIGMRGRAEGSLWTATFGDGCYSEDTVKTTNQLQTTFRVSVPGPGPYTEVRLDCVPATHESGTVHVIFSIDTLWEIRLNHTLHTVSKTSRRLDGISWEDLRGPAVNNPNRQSHQKEKATTVTGQEASFFAFASLILSP